ncbi:MAG TPA: hypothetical protein VN704_05435 [Verrucomicrobiae bacterium]|nr:hypothetical protein [Verrucomicrobiae bacterium]
MGSQRKPILIIDDSNESLIIKNIFIENKIEFVEYHIKKFEESCCGDLPTTKAPSVIAPEGIYKQKDLIINYIQYLKEKQNSIDHKNNDKLKESESIFW